MRTRHSSPVTALAGCLRRVLLAAPDAPIDRMHGADAAQEEQFERTCALVREVGFDRVNTAAYSPRPGTPAAHWPGQVADLVKLDRLNRLNRVVNEAAAERAQRFMGRDVEVRAVHRGSVCGTSPADAHAHARGAAPQQLVRPWRAASHQRKLHVTGCALRGCGLSVTG